MDNIEYLIINTHRQRQTYRDATGDWLGIHYLAAFLNEHNINTMAFAGYAHEVPELLNNYTASQSLIAVGFSCDYENQEEVIQFSRLVKEKCGLFVIIGGPQAFALDSEFLTRSQADIIIYGEGELTSYEVIENIKNKCNDWNKILGIKYMEAGALVTTPQRPLIDDLDVLPFPNAQYALGTLFRSKTASFLTGRGCPFSCAFCFEGGNTRGVRWRSVENVIDEVKQVLSERPDIHYIMFTDDTFTVDTERVRLFCNELKKLRAKYKFRWFCEGHVKTLYKQRDLLEEMVNSGMSCLQIGIESGNDDVLSAYNKNITTKMIEEVVESAFSAGLEQLWGNIILGGALETRERIQRNFEFAQRLLEIAPGMIILNTVYFWPLPGTKITTHPNQFGMTICDPNSITSCTDYPVVEYENINVKDFCNIKTAFMKGLEKTAQNLVPLIPTRRALKIIANDRRFGSNFSLWYKAIINTEAYVKFYYLLSAGASLLSETTPIECLKTAHPLRTACLETFDENGFLVINNNRLNLKETQIMCSASGKKNTLDLWEMVKGNFLDFEDYLNTMFSLESRRWITFSKY